MAMALDPISISQELRAAGFTEEQSHLLATQMAARADDVATKLDLERAVAEIELKVAQLDHKLTSEIRQLDHRLTGEIERLDHKLTGEIERVDHKLAGEIERVDHKLTAEIGRVDHKLTTAIHELDHRLSGEIKQLDHKLDLLDQKVDGLESRLVIKLGVIMATGFGLVLAAVGVALAQMG
ncbi:MAG: hypothetical protein F4X26_07345 [Chloroflexi bacterium]|nr:hypothetical protein [Chloroflexota bacterium]